MSYLPSPPLVWGSPLIVIILFLLEQMGFPLQRQADALDAGGKEADDDAQL
jgi:hypothetical protein